MSHEFAPTEPSELPYDTKVFVSNLLSTNLNQTPQAFTIFTGDIVHKKEDSWINYFDTYFGNLANYPILHNSKKTPSYYRFFTNNDYFIILSLNENSEVDADQKLFVYNAFLELEKLPDIKNVFIIDHNLDWQNPTSETNFIATLEKKLAEFPELNKFIITSNHANSKIDELTIYKEDQATKTHFFANLSNNADNTSYIKFNVNEVSKLSFEQVK